MDSGPTSDYACAYSDVFQSPEPDIGGIYLLEGAEQDDDPYRERPTANRSMSSVRMRGARAVTSSRHRSREGFTGGGFVDYEEYMPSSTTLKSSRRDRREIEGVAWDGRPHRFRPDDGPKDSQFYPPPNLRPPQGGINTPWQVGTRPSYSEAIDRPVDPNMVGLAPCPGNSVPVSKKDRFAASDAPSPAPVPAPAQLPSLGNITRGMFRGMQISCIILLFVLVVIMAMWIGADMMRKGILLAICHTHSAPPPSSPKKEQTADA